MLMPEGALPKAKREAWDEGFTACGAEFARQRTDPQYPIGRSNPYRAPRSGGRRQI